MKLVKDKNLLEALQKQFGDVSDPNDPQVQERQNRARIESQIAAQREADLAAGILDDTNYISRNLDVPGGIGGTALGMTLGAPFGPVGVGIGGITMGMVGTFGGKFASEKIKNDPNVDPMDAATHEAIISGAIDIGTLGLGKVLKPVINSLRANPNAVVAAATTPEILPTGTLASLQQTQKLLTPGGGSLLTTQTGKASTMQSLLTSIGGIGIISQRKLNKMLQKNNEVLVGEAKKIMDGLDTNLTLDTTGLGEQIFNIIDLGKKALSDNYRVGLDSITSKYGRVKVDSTKLVDTLDAFVNSKMVDDVQTLDAPALNIINDARNRIVGEGLSSKASVEKLIAVEKLLKRQIDAAGDFNATNKSQSTAELSELSTQFRNALDTSFLNTNSNLASDYQVLNSSYKRSRELLVPKIGARFLKAGDRENFSLLGKSLLDANPSEIKKMLASIDEGYAQLAKNGKEIDGVVKTSEHARASIRQSYLKTLFSDPDGTFDLFKMSSKLAKLESKEEQARLTALLGQEGFASLKRLSNAVLESKDGPGANLLSLSIRGKETNALYGLASVLQGSIALTNAATLPFILTIPSIALAIGTNRKATNKLLGLNKKVERAYASGTELAPEFIVSNLAKIIDNLSEEEKLQIKADIEARDKP